MGQPSAIAHPVAVHQEARTAVLPLPHPHHTRTPLPARRRLKGARPEADPPRQQPLGRPHDAELVAAHAQEGGHVQHGRVCVALHPESRLGRLDVVEDFAGRSALPCDER